MRAKKQLRTFLNSLIYNDEYFSKSAVISIIRALLEPIAGQNAASCLFSRIKNREGLEGLIKRLEYCNNVEMIDTTIQNTLAKDDYIELEFIIFNSSRYNFALLWDYSDDKEKNYTKLFFIVNSKNVNDVFEVLQNNMNKDYRELFYRYKPERRENELMNEAIFNVLKKVNTANEDMTLGGGDDFIVDLSDETSEEDKLKEIRHEIKNQLSILDIYTKLIEKETGESKNLSVIKKSLSLINVSINELGNFEHHQVEELNIYDIVEDSIYMNDEILKVNNNKIEFKHNNNYELKAFADETKLLSVINNILKNANEAAAGDTIILDLSIGKHDALIKITNHGEPIDEMSRRHLFDKGFTTKKKGSGIGLYFCKKYIEEVNGSIALIKSNNDETIFEIKLPIL